MRHSRLALALFGALAFAAMSGAAGAFEVQENSVDDDAATKAQFGDLTLMPGSQKLNLLRDDPALPGLPQYGNSIQIPGPGVDAPAWTYSNPYFQRR